MDRIIESPCVIVLSGCTHRIGLEASIYTPQTYRDRCLEWLGGSEVSRDSVNHNLHTICTYEAEESISALFNVCVVVFISIR